MNIRIKAAINPTEEPDRVRMAILNLFPDATVAEEGNPAGILTMTSGNIQHVFTRIHEQQIRDTARNILLKSIRRDAIFFHLNKQAAYAGRVNFTEGNSVLGDIDVEVQLDNPEELISSDLGGSK